jgi:lysophospholipase L1-like esterase
MSEPRTLLCFGDSNTWGFEPATMARYPRHVRWPGVAAAALGGGWHVVEAGLNGRTTVFEDPLGDKAACATSVPCSRAPRRSTSS